MVRRSVKAKARPPEGDEPSGNVGQMRTKVCLVGDGAVGKTSLVRRYVLDVFDDSYLRTLGTKVSKKTMDLEFPRDGIVIRLTATIWDIMGHTEFRKLVADTYFAGAKGILAVADVTRRETLENLAGWIDGVRQVAGNVPVLMIVNKGDLSDRATFGPAEVREVAEGFGCPHVTTSAKTGKMVPAAFRILGTMIAAAALGLSADSAPAPISARMG